jgi:hypothetical protein
MGIQMIRVSTAFLDDNPIARAGAIETAMMINAIRNSHAQPKDGRGWKVFVSLATWASIFCTPFEKVRLDFSPDYLV